MISTWCFLASAITSSPAYFAPTGDWGGSFSVFGSSGYLWSPVTEDEATSFSAAFYMDNFANPTTFDDRGYGHPVRCIARPVTSELQFIL